MSYTTRNYQPGDLPKQLEIMKQVTRELYEVIPYDLDQHTVERYEMLYNRAGWHPIPLKFLVYKDELVGYSGYGNYFNDLRLFFPYILGEHRTDELMQRLYDEAMLDVREAAKNYTSYRIFSRSDIDLINHNKFMEKQDFIEKEKGLLIEIDTEKLNKKISSRFKLKFFEKEDCEHVADFSKKVSTYKKPFYSKEDLLERIELGNIKPKTHILIKEDEKLQAVFGVRVGQIPDSENFIAVPNLELLDQENDDKELREAIYLSLSKVFKEYNVKKFRFEILEHSKSRTICEELGFEYIEGRGGIYYYYK